MSSKLCEEELNAQMQALKARVDVLEDSVSVLFATTGGILDTVKAVIGALPNPLDLATISPLTDFMAGGFDTVKTILYAQYSTFFKVPDFVMNLVNAPKNALLLAQIMAVGVAKDLADIASAVIDEMTEQVLAVNDLIDNLDEMVEEALEALNYALISEILEQLKFLKDFLGDVLDILDTMGGFLESMDNITQCKTKDFKLSS